MQEYDNLHNSNNAEALQQMTRLNAGQLEMMLENGSIRWIKLGNIEIVRMIYLAVRDRNWGTLNYTIKNLYIRKGKDQFSISFSILFGQPPVFEAACSITGQADNTVLFRFKGSLSADFEGNRIGLCLLHPVDGCKGKPCTITHSDDNNETGKFPEFISPHQPFKDIKRINWSPDGISAEINFSGDIFEMEDQRNWTDASFKTYCPPLEKPFPVFRKKGTQIEQAIILKVQHSNYPAILSYSSQKPIEIKIYKNNPHKIPFTGVWYNPINGAFSDQMIGLLQKTGLRHIRYDINFSEPDWQTQLNQFICDWRKWSVSIEFAFHVRPEDFHDFTNAARQLTELKPHIKFIEFFTTGYKSTQVNKIDKIIRLSRESFPESKIGAGTDYDFTEINRCRINTGSIDFIVYSICPQVHAFDDFSLIENLAAQKETVVSAKHLYPDKIIHSSVISLLRRTNPDATSKEPLSAGQAVIYDKRQHSVFGAQWGLGSLKYLMESGASLITIFETHGNNGLVAVAKSNSYSSTNEPDEIKATPFATILEHLSVFQAESILISKSDNPLVVETLIFKKNETILLVLINYSSKSQKISPLFQQAPDSCFEISEGNTLKDPFMNNTCLSCQNISFENEVVLKPKSILLLETTMNNIQVNNLYKS